MILAASADRVAAGIDVEKSPTTRENSQKSRRRMIEWRRNEFESGEGGTSGKFFVVPLHLFGSTSKNSRFGETFAMFVQFLVRCYAPPCAHQPFVKVGARAPVPYEVGATVHGDNKAFKVGSSPKRVSSIRRRFFLLANSIKK